MTIGRLLVIRRWMLLLLGMRMFSLSAVAVVAATVAVVEVVEDSTFSMRQFIFQSALQL
jgi:hypothetical protein